MACGPSRRPRRATVGARATALGFRHAVLTWEGAKPATGVQAAARAARYRLIAEHARAHGIGLVLTGHTADDQAETLLMRLARGSGLDGLAAMAPLTELPVGGADSAHVLKLGRPLLEVPKARLRATLQERGISWLEDPSNQQPAFERTRLRAARAQLEALGLTTDMLALSARRLQRARAAVERAVADFCGESAHVAVDPCGVIRIATPALRRQPAEIALRVLSWAVAAAGGSQEPIPLANIETLAQTLCASDATGAWTLARAKVIATTDTILFEREPGRESPAVLRLAPGAEAVWDGRFLVKAGARLSGALEVRALGIDGVRLVRSAAALPPAISADALRALPAFWRGESLIAAPNLAFWPEEATRGQLSATFLALGKYNSDPAAEPPRSP